MASQAPGPYPELTEGTTKVASNLSIDKYKWTEYIRYHARGWGYW